MENKRPSFDETVSVLVKAYMNDTLIHGECESCAVGEIVHAAGFPRYNRGRMKIDSCGMWKNVFFTDPVTQKQTFGSVHWSGQYFICGYKMIEATGYTIEQLAKVEYAFETAPKGSNDDEWMFNGLMAVLETLAEIHGVDLTTKEEAKKLFIKA